ncbi:MAG: hypothetical protein JWQ21_1865 [Herminiimonas sp.]|nr:hypothetical protein [Herminiimonas sp.]
MKNYLLTVSVVALLAGCGDGGSGPVVAGASGSSVTSTDGSSGASGASSNGTSATGSAQAGADAFLVRVITLLATSPDNTEPVAIDAITATVPDNTLPQPII